VHDVPRHRSRGGSGIRSPTVSVRVCAVHSAVVPKPGADWKQPWKQRGQEIDPRGFAGDWHNAQVSAPAQGSLPQPARAVDGALRRVEEIVHSLRQKLLARQLAQTAPSDHWVFTASDEPGLTAEELRQHASEVRHD
jgi:hypothetical protein